MKKQNIETGNEFYYLILANEHIQPKSQWEIQRKTIQTAFYSPEGRLTEIIDSNNVVYPWNNYQDRIYFCYEEALKTCDKRNRKIISNQQRIKEIERKRCFKNDMDTLFFGSEKIWMELMTSLDLRYQFKMDAIRAGLKFNDGTEIKLDTPIRAVMSVKKDGTVAYVSAMAMQLKKQKDMVKLVDYKTWVEGKM